MVIEVTKKGTRKFYDEMLYVITYYRKFIQRPKRKVHGITMYELMYILLSLALMVVFAGFYLYDKSISHLIFVGMFFVISLIFIEHLFLVQKTIKEYMADESPKTIVIEDDYIEFKSNTVEFKMPKDEISWIIVGKYSICVLPDNKTKLAIAITKEYEEQVMQGIEEHGYKDKLAK